MTKTIKLERVYLNPKKGYIKVENFDQIVSDPKGNKFIVYNGEAIPVIETIGAQGSNKGVWTKKFKELISEDLTPREMVFTEENTIKKGYYLKTPEGKSEFIEITPAETLIKAPFGEAVLVSGIMYKAVTHHSHNYIYIKENGRVEEIPGFLFKKIFNI